MNIEELQKINKLQQEKITSLEEELEKTKEHLKKYTAPKRNKKFYENPIPCEKRKEYNKKYYIKKKTCEQDI